MWKQLAKHGVENAIGLAKGNAMKKAEYRNYRIWVWSQPCHITITCSSFATFLKSTSSTSSTSLTLLVSLGTCVGYSPSRGGFRLTPTSCTSESVDCRTREAREAREVRELAEDLDTALFLSAWLDFMHHQNGH